MAAIFATNWTTVLKANSFKTVSDLRFLECLVSREAILFLSCLKSSVFYRLRAGCEVDMSSYEAERVRFPKDLIGESGDVLTHVFLFVPSHQREKKVFIKGETPCLLRTSSIKEGFESKRRDFKFRLLERGYPQKLVNKIQAEVKSSSRNSALKYKLKTSKTFYRSSPPTTQV